MKFTHNAGHEGTPEDDSYVRETGHPSYRADDALWLFPTVYKYVAETGDLAFLDEVVPFANRGEGTVYEHLKRALAFSQNHLGPHGMPAGLCADWNDCLRLGANGESSFVAFQYLKDHGEEIRQSVLAGRYEPQPVRRVEIPKDNGKTRKLGIPTAVNHFSRQTNINTNNRIICYDIHELGDSMKRPALLIMLDAIWNRVVRNRAAGRFTHIYIDEIYLFFSKDDGASKNSASFLWECWKRCRKYYATLTGITQNVEDCLNSESARGMIANSEFLMMFNQAPNDRAVLQELLKLSDEQMSYVKDSLPGQGLLKVGGAVVPFIDELPTNTSLYRMMTPKPEES